MPVDERTRRVMTEGLVRHLGEEVTDALLAHLPPVGWADVATKQDLEHLADRLRAEFHHALREALARQTRTFVLAMIFTTTGAVLTTAGLAFAAARLA